MHIEDIVGGSNGRGSRNRIGVAVGYFPDSIQFVERVSDRREIGCYRFGCNVSGPGSTHTRGAVDPCDSTVCLKLENISGKRGCNISVILQVSGNYPHAAGYLFDQRILLLLLHILLAGEGKGSQDKGEYQQGFFHRSRG